MRELQRNTLRKLVTKDCENCNAPFESENARYCCKECRTARDKGGKTYDEKRLAVISRCNERWVNSKPRSRVDVDPKHINMTTY